jgi:fibronectin type 3 domain-containing protein
MVGDLIIEAPSNFSKTVSGSSNDVILSWGSVERAEQYNIYVSRLGGGVGYSLLDSITTSSGNLLLSSAETNTISYTHQNAADDEYFYVVTAISSEGYESNFSLEVPYRLFIPITIKD